MRIIRRDKSFDYYDVLSNHDDTLIYNRNFERIPIYQHQDLMKTLNIMTVYGRKGGNLSPIEVINNFDDTSKHDNRIYFMDYHAYVFTICFCGKCIPAIATERIENGYPVGDQYDIFYDCDSFIEKFTSSKSQYQLSKYFFGNRFHTKKRMSEEQLLRLRFNGESLKYIENLNLNLRFKSPIILIAPYMNDEMNFGGRSEKYANMFKDCNLNKISFGKKYTSSPLT